ncbi:MAG TPA: hypothetical protein VFU22_13170 [Roseiflexaceae bacterium]|nr:hypothetical protein [Roseiflexaceae bacterium]
MTTIMRNSVHATLASAIPGPRPLPMIGPTGNVFRYISDPIGHTRQLFQQYGPIVALAAGGKTNLFSPYGSPGTIFVYGPELIRQVRTPHESWNFPPLTGTLYPLSHALPSQRGCAASGGA